MNPAPTFIDTLYRATFNNKQLWDWRDNALVRKHLVEAKRFVLDDEMSTFLGDLSTAAFAGGYKIALGARLCEQMRISARLPYPVMWVEYNLQLAMTRTMKLIGNNRSYDPKQSPMTEGWLLMQHPILHNAISMHVFTQTTKEQAGEHNRDGYMHPAIYTWTVDDTPPPGYSIMSHIKEVSETTVATGIYGYSCDSIKICTSPLASPEVLKDTARMYRMIREWVGVLRRTWALLATINDIPVTVTNVQQTRGFVAGYAYRKYLDHQTITLHVPARQDTRTLARKLIAAARRRAHDVRGHWRKDWHNLGDTTCKHEWNVEQQCILCLGRRFWIPPHRRGDESLGFVSHDYEVKHDA